MFVEEETGYQEEIIRTKMGIVGKIGKKMRSV
jgi:hypothetical protein